MKISPIIIFFFYASSCLAQNEICDFKKEEIGVTFKRVGFTPFDKMSEEFSCDLKSKGIATIMFVKKITDNGSSSKDVAYTLWKENDKGYMKKFENKTRDNPTETATVEYNWDELLSFFKTNNVKDELREPSSYWSHYTNLVVQLWYENEFYSFSMQLACPEEDELLQNVKFVRLIDSKLK